MTTKTDQPNQEKNEEFGLPRVEFKPIGARGRQWFKITAIIVGLVLTIGAGIVYWFFYHSPTTDPAKKIARMLEKHETRALKSDADLMYSNTSSKHETVEQEAKPPKLAKKPETLEEKEATKNFSTSRTAQLHKGTITNINTAQGYYYIVLGSFIDKDLASDYAHQLMQKSVEVTLIAPPKRQHYFRVAIKQGKKFRDAYEKAEALKAAYGPDIWVMKY